MLSLSSNQIETLHLYQLRIPSWIISYSCNSHANPVSLKGMPLSVACDAIQHTDDAKHMCCHKYTT